MSLVGTSDTVREEQKAQLITNLLNSHVYSELPAIVISERETPVASEDAEQAEQLLGSLEVDGVELPASFKAVANRLLVNQSAIQRELEQQVQEVTDEQDREAYDVAVAEPTLFENYRCVSHILVAFNTSDTNDVAPEIESEPTSEEVEAALNEVELVAQRMTNGEDFASVATEVSDDVGSREAGGYLGCNFEGVFVPEFEDAVFSLNVDEISEPVRTKFGYHIIRLDGIGVPSFENVSTQLRAELEQEASDTRAAFEELFLDAASRTTVVVNPEYGVWDPETGSVVSPADEQTNEGTQIENSEQGNQN